MKVIFPLFYFAPIEYFSALNENINKGNEIIFEINDNYQKQSYRNRCLILNSNNIQNLTIPISHNKTRPYKLKQTCEGYNWRMHHLKSLKSAYLSSPYFEYYQDYFEDFFDLKINNLQNINTKSLKLICNLLQIDCDFTTTENYIKNYDSTEYLDLRNAFDTKQKTDKTMKKYTQVFSINEHSFVENLSILDLLFSEGTNALDYL